MQGRTVYCTIQLRDSGTQHPQKWQVNPLGSSLALSSLSPGRVTAVLTSVTRGPHLTCRFWQGEEKPYWRLGCPRWDPVTLDASRLGKHWWAQLLFVGLYCESGIRLNTSLIPIAAPCAWYHSILQMWKLRLGQEKGIVQGPTVWEAEAGFEPRGSLVPENLDPVHCSAVLAHKSLPLASRSAIETLTWRSVFGGTSRGLMRSCQMCSFFWGTWRTVRLQSAKRSWRKCTAR